MKLEKDILWFLAKYKKDFDYLNSLANWDKKFPTGELVNLISGGGPSTNQEDFRVRNDDGSETGATWKAAINTNIGVVMDTNFRIRISVAETKGDSGTATPVPQLQYNKNSAGWNNVTTSSSVLRSFSSANFTDDASTTAQMTAHGSFVTGHMDSTGVTSSVSLLGNYTELEFNVQLRSADLTTGDSVQVRVSDAGTALTAYTNTPTFLFTVTTTKTQTGKARLTVTATKTQTGKTRITVTTTKTQTGKADIRNTTGQNITGKTRVTASTPETITAMSRITVVTPNTQSGKADIYKITDQTIQGKGNVSAPVSKTQAGVSSIISAQQHLMQGKSLILHPTWEQRGISRITAVQDQTLAGVAHIAQGRNQLGVANINNNFNRILFGLSSILVATLNTLIGRTRVTGATPRELTAKARVIKSATQVIFGLANVSATLLRRMIAVSQIRVVTEQMNNGVTNILNAVTRNQSGKGDIRITTSQTEQGKARLAIKSSTAQLGVARIVINPYGQTDTITIMTQRNNNTNTAIMPKRPVLNQSGNPSKMRIK